MDSLPQQLPLSVGLDDSATFDNFYIDMDSTNAMLVEKLRALPIGEFVYLWGKPSSGRTHLLQALCHQFSDSSIYLPLSQFQDCDPADIFSGLEQLSVVILDDVHLVVQSPAWSEQLFHLYNRVQQNSKSLVLSANSTPRTIESPLLDLKSRLTAMSIYRVDVLSDEAKVASLMQRAANRGLDMSARVAQYLLVHLSRDMNTQIGFLDKLDKESLTTQRKLSISLVKDVWNS